MIAYNRFALQFVMGQSKVPTGLGFLANEDAVNVSAVATYVESGKFDPSILR